MSQEVKTQFSPTKGTLPMNVRCLIGMIDNQGQVECPASFTLSKRKRQKAWDELQKEVNKRDIIIENIDWSNRKYFSCSYDKTIDDKMIKLLDMDESDIPWKYRLFNH